jgi:hypothetical protein
MIPPCNEYGLKNEKEFYNDPGGKATIFRGQVGSMFLAKGKPGDPR